MPRIDAQNKLENFIKSRRVVQMRDLFEVVESTSRMTVFRRLSGVEYLCSYTHTGRYYTLFDIARFDSDSIWFYDDIGFSRNGSLKKTVTYLVDNGDGGQISFRSSKTIKGSCSQRVIGFGKIKADKANKV